MRREFMTDIGRTVAGTDLGACPFCGADISAAIEDGGVLHMLPTCDRFDRLDALEFIVAVREERERKVARA
jgi:hypothetical protein